METHRLVRWSLCAVVTLLLSPGSAWAEDKVTRFELDNGLDVVLRPVAGTEDVAVLVLFDLGENQDPKGQSGRAHLIEHLYVTSAAGDVEARTADEMMQAYPMRWNAQTGSRYTVIAFVEPLERLAPALDEAAARMSDLRITEREFEREQVRVTDELMRMYWSVPSLSVRNRARSLVKPLPGGGRRGGIPAQIMELDYDALRAEVARTYKPANARLVLTGGIDVESARTVVEATFGKIPAGERVPATDATRRAPKKRLEVQKRGSGRGEPHGLMTLAFRVPPPGDESWGAFLVLAAKLTFRAKKLAPLQPLYLPLDDPGVLYLTHPLTSKGAASYQAGEIRKTLADILKEPLKAMDKSKALMFLGQLLGTAPLPDLQLRNNLYGLAFRLARMDQLGVTPAAVREAVLDTTSKQMKTLADTWFGPKHGVVAAVVDRN